MSALAGYVHAQNDKTYARRDHELEDAHRGPGQELEEAVVALGAGSALGSALQAYCAVMPPSTASV